MIEVPRLSKLFTALTIVITLLVCVPVFAQPAIEWEFTLGGSNSEGSRKMLPTDDGVIVVGSSSSNDFDFTQNQGEADAVIFKVNSDGNLLWQHTYGGSGYDMIYDIVETADEGFIAVGSTSSNDGDVGENNGMQDFWVFKLDDLGILQWSETYGGSNEESACSVYVTQDGGFIVAGDSRSSDGDVSNNYGQIDSWVIRLDSSGDLIWEKNYGGSASDKATSIIQISDGGYILVTGTESNDFDISQNYSVIDDDDDGEDIWVVRLDAQGEIVWEQNYGGSGEDTPECLLKLDEENYVIGGRTTSSNFDLNDPNGSNDGWIFQINDQAEIAWSNSLGGTAWDRVNGITKGADDGILFAGFSYSNDGEVSNNNGEQDVWIGKLSDSGVLMWEKNYGGSDFESARSIIQTSDGHILFTGSTRSSDIDVEQNNGSDDIWVVCLDSSIPSNIDPIQDEETSIYPNPASGQLTISLSSIKEVVECKIYSVAGELVLSNTLAQVNTRLDLSDLSPGVYTVYLSSNFTSSTRKVVVE